MTLLVVAYHPLLNSLGKVLSKNLNILLIDEKIKTVLYLGPMFSFRRARKVSRYYVRAQLYSLKTTVGSLNYKKSRCQVWLKVNETDFSTSTVTKKTYKINHKFNCSDKCLTYLLTCLIQFSNSICRPNCRWVFSYRWNN